MSEQFTEQQVLLADALYSAALNGSAVGCHMSSWMNDWRIGDTVIERSTRSIRPWSARIGVMLQVLR